MIRPYGNVYSIHDDTEWPPRAWVADDRDPEHSATGIVYGVLGGLFTIVAGAMFVGVAALVGWL